jgi:hypothetical protein
MDLAMAGVRPGRRSPKGVAVEGTQISFRKCRYRDIDDRLALSARHSLPCMDVPAKKIERLFGVTACCASAFQGPLSMWCAE